MTIDGEPSKKKYRVFIFQNGQTVGTPVGEYETLGDLRKHRQRLDRVEVIVQRRKDGTKYIPIREFLGSKKDEPDES
jgi:hypothetical protein